MLPLPKRQGDGVDEMGGADGTDGAHDAGEAMDEREDKGVAPDATQALLTDNDNVDGLVPNASQALGSFLM